MEIDREHVQTLFDIVIDSLDFGSGFLDDSEVECLRKVAVALDVDPMLATPNGYRGKYPHAFSPYMGVCRWCRGRWEERDPIHVGVPDLLLPSRPPWRD